MRTPTSLTFAGADRWRAFHTCRVKQYLSAIQLAELADLLEDAPRRVGVVELVLQAAAEGRGMTLRLTGPHGELEDQ
jgi:hypothetical protein